MSELDWIHLPDGSQFAEGVRDGVKGAFWVTYDPTLPGDAKWVASFRPDPEKIKIYKDDLPRRPVVGDRFMVDAKKGPTLVEVTSISGDEVRTRVV